jgi:two-component system, OmpR family, phosphate regulon sensor histidine kinase PhoR
MNTLTTQTLHTLVHEFQTPIAAIRMAADVLDSPITHNNPQRTSKYVQIIREETDRLQQQVEVILSLARADRHALYVCVERLDIHELTRSVAQRHGTYLTLNLLATQSTLLADRLHLTNVLHNLIDNAVKYSQHRLDVQITTTTKDNGLAITISDRGIGIPNEFQAQIFEPFYRVNAKDSPSVKGFGLGLSYVKKIMEAHQWEISVHSEVGIGSEFSILIPTSPSSLHS